MDVPEPVRSYLLDVRYALDRLEAALRGKKVTEMHESRLLIKLDDVTRILDQLTIMTR